MFLPVIGLPAALYHFAVGRGCIYHLAVADIDACVLDLLRVITIEEQYITWLKLGFIFYLLPVSLSAYL